MAAVFGSADKLNDISIGMTKAQVISVLGPPRSTSATNGIEYMQYSWVKSAIAANANFPVDYYVALQNGKVTSYGQKGDFNSTKVPTRRIEIDQTVRHDDASTARKDLYLELKKLQDLKESGVITDEEFRSQKKKLLDQN